MSENTLGRPGRPPAKGGGADRAIRLSTAGVVLAVAGIAAYISYWHAYAVVREYGETGVTARLEPATIDGLVYASSMVLLYSARHRLPVPRLARWMLALGILASLAVNVAQGCSHGLTGAIVAAWPAASLVGSYEMLAWIIRTAAEPGAVPARDTVPASDPVSAADQDGAQADQDGAVPAAAEEVAIEVAGASSGERQHPGHPGHGRVGHRRPCLRPAEGHRQTPPAVRPGRRPQARRIH